MPRRTTLMLSSTVDELEKTGNPVKGSAWYGFSEGVHTIQISVTSFIGRIGIQATLVKKPEESDWFDIHLQGVDKPQIIYEAPLDRGITDTRTFTIRGNFMWLRAYMDRKNIPAAQDLDRFEWFRLGMVNRILLHI